MKEIVVFSLLILAVSVASDLIRSNGGTSNTMVRENVSNRDTHTLAGINGNVNETNNASSRSPSTSTSTSASNQRQRYGRNRQRYRPNNSRSGWHRRPHHSTRASQTSRHGSENSSRLGRRIPSPFQDIQTANNFLSSNIRSRVMPNERTRENRALNALMAEGMCEVFNKHFYPNSLGGQCL